MEHPGPWLIASEPALILAPMEGVTDAPMRAVQGETGAFTFAVSEFLRIGQVVQPAYVFLRHVPELAAGGRTPTGLPVQLQLLGGDPDRMAEAAVRGCAAGARAIDINFGCPARTVNRHDGGATLLKYPKRIRDIVAAVRSALPVEIPLSAKLRLGWEDKTAIFENAAMAAAGGASWLTIHARTREQGYAPPVDWRLVGSVRESLSIPVVANGDIWDLDGFRRCRDESGCRHFMLGRGALANPGLANQIAVEMGIGLSGLHASDRQVDWPSRLKRLVDWTQTIQAGASERTVHRLKQWLKMAATFGNFTGFESVKRARNLDEFFSSLSAA